VKRGMGEGEREVKTSSELLFRLVTETHPLYRRHKRTLTRV
jgi:hypothetical protein